MTDDFDTARFSALLEALGRTFGIPDLRPDEAGGCTLSFDDHVVMLQQDPAGRSLTVHTDLGTLAADVSTRRLQHLLAANLFWAGTGGATLSLLEEDRTVVLARRFDLGHLEPPEFESALELFLNAADGWRAELAAPDEGADSPDALPAGPPAGMKV